MIRKEIEASPSTESTGIAKRDKLAGFATNERRSIERIMAIFLDQPDDAAWFIQAVRELAGYKKTETTRERWCTISRNSGS